MSEEVELERLVVRLMGDGSDYSSMMEDASEKADKFSGDIEKTNKEVQSSFSTSSDEIANSAQTMSAFDGINRGAGRSLSMTGRTISQVGIAAAAMNPALGQSVVNLGMMASGAGQAVRSLDLMRRSGASLMGLALNPIALMALPAAAVGFLLWKKRADDAKVAADSFAASLGRLKQEMEYVAKIRPQADVVGIEGINSEKFGYTKTDQNRLNLAKQRQSELNESAMAMEKAKSDAASLQGALVQAKWNLENGFGERFGGKEGVKKLQEEFNKASGAIRVTSYELKMARIHAKEAGDAIAVEMEISNKSTRIARERIERAGLKGESPEQKAMLDYWEKNKQKNRTPEQKAEYDLGLEEVRKNALAQTQHARDVEIAQIKIARDMEIEGWKSKLYLTKLTGVELASQSAMEVARLQNMKAARDAEISHKLAPPPIDTVAAGERAEKEARVKLEFDYAEALKKTRIEERHFTSELAAARNPRNEALQSAINIAKAYDLWALSNKDLVATEGEKQKKILATAETQRLMLQHAQEGASIHEKYLFPDEKMAIEQQHMKKLLDEGAISLSDYNKALTDVWLQMHKEYSVDLKMQGAGALVGGTSAAWIAMQNQQRSMRSLDKDLFGNMQVAGKAGGGMAGDTAKAQISTADYMRQLLGLAQAHWVGAPVEVKVAD